MLGVASSCSIGTRKLFSGPTGKYASFSYEKFGLKMYTSEIKSTTAMFLSTSE